MYFERKDNTSRLRNSLSLFIITKHQSANNDSNPS